MNWDKKICRISCVQYPNHYIISPHPSANSLRQYRKDLENLIARVQICPIPLERNDCVAVRCEQFKTWERALVVHSKTEGGILKHFVFTVDRGYFSWEDDVRLVPSKFFYALKLSAVRLKLDGIFPIMTDWSREAMTFGRSVVNKKAVVRVTRLDEQILFGDLLIMSEYDEPVSLRQTLVDQLWGILVSPQNSAIESHEPEESRLASVDEELSDSDSDVSFKSALAE